MPHFPAKQLPGLENGGGLLRRVETFFSCYTERLGPEEEEEELQKFS